MVRRRLERGPMRRRREQPPRRLLLVSSWNSLIRPWDPRWQGLQCGALCFPCILDSLGQVSHRIVFLSSCAPCPVARRMAFGSWWHLFFLMLPPVLAGPGGPLEGLSLSLPCDPAMGSALRTPGLGGPSSVHPALPMLPVTLHSS